MGACERLPTLAVDACRSPTLWQSHGGVVVAKAGADVLTLVPKGELSEAHDANTYALTWISDSAAEGRLLDSEGYSLHKKAAMSAPAAGASTGASAMTTPQTR
jgi:hypothetical protein